MTTPHGKLRREIERQLAALPTPPPPDDLLARIRAEIPATLAPANADSVEPRRRPLLSLPVLRLAAALGVVAIGLSVAVQVVRKNDEMSAGTTAIAVRQDPVEPRAKAAPGARKSPQPAATAPQPVVVETAPLTRLASEPETPAHSPETTAAAPRPRFESARKIARADEAAAAPARSALRERGLPEEATAPRVDDSSRSAQLAAAPPRQSDEATELRALGYVGRSASEARSRRVETVIAAPSTGGSAEPLDQPVGDMFFRGTGTNPFVDAAEDRLSTFALDVDTGSWTLARSYLDRGALPPAEEIRVEEFVNAQRYDDPAPRHGDFTLVGEGAPSPFAPPGDYRLLRFAVKGRELGAAERRPAILTFVVDVSGSMDRENRLGLVRRALGLLLDELRPDDRVGLVVYGSRGRVLLRHTRDHEAIREAIGALRPEGSTNAEEGLRLAYDLANQAFRRGASNRLILCSDGVANVGATGPESILDRIGREARRGIELTTVGFGMGNYNDALMEQLADQGDGRYHYVDTLAEARRIFVDELAGTLETIAKDAKVQVEFDPAVVERWRLVGYENRDVADRDFRNDAIDAGELGAGHAAVALYEIRLAPGAHRNDRLATLRLRWKSTATGRIEEASLVLRVRDLESSFRHASSNLRRAALAAELGEMLRGSYYAREASWQLLRDEAHRLDRDTVGRRDVPKLDDLTGMIERAAQLAGATERGDDRDD